MTHQEIWQAIEQFAAINKLSCSGLAKHSGLDPTTFNRSKRWSPVGQPRWPSTQSIAKILSFTGSDIDGFVKCMKPECLPQDNATNAV